MTSILFERPEATYLPEIDAYVRYLRKEFPKVTPYISTDVPGYDPNDFDIVWRFMGMDIRGGGRYVVHEYNSFSAPPFPHLRNQVKKLLNRKPDRRVFLNKIVHRGFNFRDGVPYSLRDMGIAAQFFEHPLTPEYDFVYAGSMHRGPEVMRILDHFSKHMKGSTILLIGTVGKAARAHFSKFENIIFAGRVPYNDVPKYMAKGRYALNLVPDEFPFNVQTATKVLEYCALGLPIVSMKYRWAENFARMQGAKMFWLSPDFSNLTPENIAAFDFQTPDVTNRRWKTVIERSGVFDFLREF